VAQLPENPVRLPVPPPPGLDALVAGSLGRAPVQWWRPHTGLSPAERFVVRFADGSSAFVKAAVDPRTEAELRIEHEILRGDADFLPRTLAWVEAGPHPLLIVEDLSGAHWPADHSPVTWLPDQFGILFETLERVADAVPPASLPAAELELVPQWPAIAREADRFLALGLCSEGWFRSAVGALIDAEAAVPLAGESLVHGDVRSDNLCFAGTRMVLVDWGGARRGHRHHDLAAVLTTLPLEGGPEPFDVFPGGGSWAAYHAGGSARRAYRSSDAGNGRKAAPEWLQKVLRRMTAISLDWAARALGLPPCDGPHWSAIR
jgi:hypothetical protein